MTKLIVLLIICGFLIGCAPSYEWVLRDIKTNVDLSGYIFKRDCVISLGYMIKRNITYTDHPERLKCVYKEYGE